MRSVGIHCTIVIAIHDRDTTGDIAIGMETGAITHTIVIHGATGVGEACPAYHEEILVDVMDGRWEAMNAGAAVWLKPSHWPMFQ